MNETVGTINSERNHCTTELPFSRRYRLQFHKHEDRVRVPIIQHEQMISFGLVIEETL